MEMASLLGDHSIQRDINNESLAKLRTFFRQALATVAALEPPLVAPAWDVPELEQQLRQIEETVAHASNTKNVHILQLTAAFCRSLGGARVVMCKSAKDRTGMAVTLEQAHLLKKFHSLDFIEVPRVTGLFRLYGTRPENALKNIGERMFAFNSLQRRMLPADYRPPVAVGGTWGLMS